MQESNYSNDPSIANAVRDLTVGLWWTQQFQGQSKKFHLAGGTMARNTVGRIMQISPAESWLNKKGESMVSKKPFMAWAADKRLLRLSKNRKMTQMAGSGFKRIGAGAKQLLDTQSGSYLKNKAANKLIGSGLRRLALPLMRISGYASSLIYWEMGAKLAYSTVRDTYHMAMNEKGLEWKTQLPSTRQAATSRQRAVRAITEGRMQAKSAIGNEARLFHR